MFSNNPFARKKALGTATPVKAAAAVPKAARQVQAGEGGGDGDGGGGGGGEGGGGASASAGASAATPAVGAAQASAPAATAAAAAPAARAAAPASAAAAAAAGGGGGGGGAAKAPSAAGAAAAAAATTGPGDGRPRPPAATKGGASAPPAKKPAKTLAKTAELMREACAPYDASRASWRLRVGESFLLNPAIDSKEDEVQYRNDGVHRPVRGHVCVTTFQMRFYPAQHLKIAASFFRMPLGTIEQITVLDDTAPMAAESPNTPATIIIKCKDHRSLKFVGQRAKILKLSDLLKAFVFPSKIDFTFAFQVVTELDKMRAKGEVDAVNQVDSVRACVRACARARYHAERRDTRLCFWKVLLSARPRAKEHVMCNARACCAVI
jgi:hypothetical protein